MKIILLNYPYLRDELSELGVEVFSAGLQPDCDRTFTPDEYSLTNILKASPFQPDFIIFMDSIERVIPAGIEDSPVPLAAYFIDSTINRFWQRPFAYLFDLVLTDQKDDAAAMQDDGINARWFPLTADTSICQPVSGSKAYNITFVGSRNSNNRIKRENILNLLQRHFDIGIFSGDPFLSAVEAAEVYSRSRLVLNENLYPSVNLRLFEAMACGTVVLTEDNAPGLGDLFRDGDHLVTYNPDNLIDRVRYYLEHDAERERISRAGSELVRERHSMKARSGELIDSLDNMRGSQIAVNRGGSTAGERPHWQKLARLGKALLFFGVKWSKRDPTALMRARECLDASLDIKPNLEAFLSLGMLFSLTGEHRAAEVCYRAATKLAPDDYRGPLYRAFALVSLGSEGEAMQLFRIAERLTVSNSDPPPVSGGGIKGGVEFHLFWADYFRRSGRALSPGLMRFDLPMQFWTSLEHLRKAADIDPANWEAVGDLLMEHHAPDQALGAYRQAGAGVPKEKIKAAERGAYLF